MAKRRIGIAIDMTPMVDVAFLLLIFFMTTTQFKPPEKVGVELPGSKSEIHVPETKTIILTINKEGEIYISDENLSQTQLVPLESLVSAITTWRTKNMSAVVVVKGDKESDYGTVARFAHTVGTRLVRRDPEHLTQEFYKTDRGGRILVDTARNEYSATFAAAYAVRPKRGAPVSAPCTWKEVERGEVGPTTFTLRDMPARVAAVGDVWADLLETKQSLKHPIATLSS